MTPERFTALLEAYGGCPDRWPVAEREAAVAFAALHPSAREAVEAATLLDRTLDAWTVPGPGSVLAARVAMIGAPRRRLGLLRSGLAAAALATGFAAGAAVVAVSAIGPEAGGSSLYSVTVLGAPLDLDADPAPRGPA